MEKEMKLSEAMLVGEGMKERNPRVFLGYDTTGKLCGCAIGGASLAAGYTEGEDGSVDDSLAFAVRKWDWLIHRPHVTMISDAYDVGIDAAVAYAKAQEARMAEALAVTEPELVEV